MNKIDLKKIISEELKNVFNNLKGDWISKTIIGLTTVGSEHGPEELIRGAEEACRNNPMLDVVLIGPDNYGSNLSLYKTGSSLKECHKEMELLLDEAEIDGAVTLHYDFPVGVTTVGKTITPGKGKEIFISSTTGTAAINRIEAMIYNAIYGIAIAKAHGLTNPTVGVLNVEGARVVEKSIIELTKSGYKINPGTSARADGGIILRGNDLLSGEVDVVLTDTLTGNILIKLFSAFHTGGNYEGIGYGYGPAVGKNYQRKIAIISRASGASVIKGALLDMLQCLKGEYTMKVESEVSLAEKAGLREQISKISPASSEKKIDSVKPLISPKPVDEEIPGIDVLLIDEAVRVLHKQGIYAEPCMGCTGPAVRVSFDDKSKALDILRSEKIL